jgi:hypothetical protein
LKVSNSGNSECEIFKETQESDEKQNQVMQKKEPDPDQVEEENQK